MDNDTIDMNLSGAARMAVDNIRRNDEGYWDVILRILETLAATSADFDEFYGAPRDGRGPSGE